MARKRASVGRIISGLERPSSLLLLLAVAGCARGRTESTVSLAGYRPASAERVRAAGWRTDLARLDVPLESVAISHVPRTAFVPIAAPRYAAAADVTLDPAEPVVVVRTGDGLQAWPLVHLRKRELVLDELDGVPIAVTFCSLCATARVWDRRAGGSTLELGVSGMLLAGNSLLYDRQTESWWRQIDGRAIAGDHRGERLRPLSSFVVSLGELARSRPDARVMVRADGPEPPIRLLTARNVASGEPPDWLSLSCPRPLESVLAVAGRDTPVSVLGPRVEHVGSVVVFRDSTAAVPYRDEGSRPALVAGSAVAFRPEVDARTLSFVADARGVYDRETRSRWNGTGEAFEGPLAGRRLTPVRQVLGFRYALIDGDELFGAASDDR